MRINHYLKTLKQETGSKLYSGAIADSYRNLNPMILRSWFLISAFIWLNFSCSTQPGESKEGKQPAGTQKSGSGIGKNTVALIQDYNPVYWVEGAAERQHGVLSDAEADSLMEEVFAKGWRGITYWGADRDGAKMNYFFRSPFLEKQEWAVYKNDGLSPLVKAAHKKGMKVMINIEGVNPYHWEQNQWTPENIRAVADDMAADGADAVFEECFEVKADVFISLARQLKSKGVDYLSGTDPMLLREANFSTLWPETSIIDIYNYYLKRDKIFNIATLAQHGSLGFGWAKYWGKPTSLISPVNRNWGIPGDYSQAVIPYLCMIRALQFRLDNFIIFGGLDTFDPLATQAWIGEYVNKQEKEKPLMNIVVLLRKQKDYSGSESGDPGWNRLFNSGDAITSGAMNAGYNIVVSDKVLPADAYWIYASGGKGDILPEEVVDLFSTGKPVFIQCGSFIPSGIELTPGWKTVLEKCGVDGNKTFSNRGGRDSEAEGSLPPNQEAEIPYTGYYKDTYLRFTGSDVQRGMDLRSGTVIPKDAISGTVYCSPNKTYGRGPYITGKDKKYLVTATTLNWEVAYPVSDLLAGCGILPSSNVWGIAGKNVTALLAIETTELVITIPGLKDGSRIHTVIWDNKKNKKSEETIVYKAPYRHLLMEYDFILIDKVNKQ
jgi:hypothetical protein